jgi:hypothetical protein
MSPTSLGVLLLAVAAAVLASLTRRRALNAARAAAALVAFDAACYVAIWAGRLRPGVWQGFTWIAIAEMIWAFSLFGLWRLRAERTGGRAANTAWALYGGNMLVVFLIAVYLLHSKI